MKCYLKERERTSVGEDLEILEPLYTVGGGVE